MSSLSGMSAAATKERIPELDILRGLAFLAVVFQHSLGYYAQSPDIRPAEAAVLGMILHFTKFAVPAFVFVTGATLFYNYYDRLNYPSFIKKRALDILAPYLIWTCIYEIHFNGLPHISAVWLKEFGKTVLSGSEIYHLWFVIMIFQFYLAYPLLLYSFKKARGMLSSRPRTVSAVILLAGGYAWLMWVSHSYIPQENLHLPSSLWQALFIDYRDRNFLFFIFYFIMGGLAGAGIMKWRFFVSRSVSWNSFLFAALYVWIGYELLAGGLGGRIDFNCSTPLKPSMFFYTVSEILLVYGLAMTISGRVSYLRSFLAFTGKYSYGAYLSHALALKYAVSELGAILPAGHIVLSSVLAFVLCALGSLALTFLIGFLPYGKLVIGPYQRPAGKVLLPGIPPSVKKAG